MKKFLSGLVAAFLLTFGFVAVSAPTASAAACGNAYVECVSTKTKASAPKKVVRGAKAVVKVNVTAQGAKPAGKVTITVKGKGVNFSKTVNYTGAKVSIATPKLVKKGTYKVTITFAAKSGSTFKNSKASATITVK